MRKISVLLMVVVLGGVCARGGAAVVAALGDIKSQEELTKAITTLDKELFDAYNNCDIDKLGSLVVDDLEFYHDKTGLRGGRRGFLDGLRTTICGRGTGS